MWAWLILSLLTSRRTNVCLMSLILHLVYLSGMHYIMIFQVNSSISRTRSSMTMEFSSSFIHMTMLTLRRAFKDHFAAFGFIIFKEWLRVNRLRLHSAKHVDKTTNLFQVVLLICATKTIGFDLDKRCCDVGGLLVRI